MCVCARVGENMQCLCGRDIEVCMTLKKYVCVCVEIYVCMFGNLLVK